MTVRPNDFYSKNSDFTGKRVVNADIQEIVDFHASSAVRIWCNEQSDSFPAHWHSALEIILPMEEWYDAVVGKEQFHLVPGDILFIPPRAMHALTAPDTGMRFVFLFDISPLSALPGFSSLQPVLSSPLHITRCSHPHIYEDTYQDMVRMRNEYFGSEEFAELTVFSLLLGVLIRLGTDSLRGREFSLGARPNKQREYFVKFNDVLSYINDHYKEDCRLEDIAAAYGFSKYHFARLFRQYTGFTFCSYLLHLRILAAQELLSRPELSITEIAMQSGFSSISTFNRVFRQQVNCSPTEYREKRRPSAVSALPHSENP